MIAKASPLVLLVVLAFSPLPGCTASASLQGGGAPSAAPPPPPPPPPPAVAPAASTPPPAATPVPTTPAPVAATPPAKPNVSGSLITIPGQIEFESGKATFKAGTETEATLGQLKQFLDENPRVTKLRIEGHTDNVGSAPSNEQLSGERALAIKKFLVDKGIVKTRLLAVGFGQSRPIADNSTEEGRAKNRRTEFRIAELSGKPYLGSKDPAAGGKIFDF
jgi:OOP family OmpA-OmpF porin